MSTIEQQASKCIQQASKYIVRNFGSDPTLSEVGDTRSMTVSHSYPVDDGSNRPVDDGSNSNDCVQKCPLMRVFKGTPSALQAHVTCGGFVFSAKYEGVNGSKPHYLEMASVTFEGDKAGFYFMGVDGMNGTEENPLPCMHKSRFDLSSDDYDRNARALEAKVSSGGIQLPYYRGDE